MKLITMKENQIHSFTEAQTTGIELEIATDLHAGFPNPASDHAGETIDLTREMIRHPESTFYARIAGDSMLDAGIRDGDIVVEKRQGLKVACLEGIAYRQGWISEERMRELAQPMLKNQYGQYLLKVIDDVKQNGFSNLD